VDDLVTSGPTEAQLRSAYSGRRVLVTGHTGFKGSWLTLWLTGLGAEVTGYALAPDTSPSLFERIGLVRDCRSVIADVRDAERLTAVVEECRPEMILHLAAQPLVRRSYERPMETLGVNVMGTGNLLEAVRAAHRPCAVVVVTSDKCYENREWLWGYREDEAMGGHDVYSMSKGAAELVTAAWRRSFFPPQRVAEHGVSLATARAGNVMGGGDWAADRIVVDSIAALAGGRPIPVRSPASIRPWQHVLEPLSGYLWLGARLLGPERASACEAWNFGPRQEDARPVRELVETLIRHWGSGSWVDCHDPAAPHEARQLRLSIEKALTRLGWGPRWRFDVAVQRTVQWYRAFHSGASANELADLCRRQIHEYLES
jgi:CDP-glucose 4,6-dehydratase